jgi:seryl-tRNA synthetase
MHNLKEIRKNFDDFKNLLEKRNVNIDFDYLKKLDEKNRDLIQKKENYEKEKKDISKLKDESLFKKSKEISSQLDLTLKEQNKIRNELDTILSSIPNLPHVDVPTGKSENDNIEILKSGIITKFDFRF